MFRRNRSKFAAFWWLLVAFICHHLVLQANQQVLDSCGFLPLLQKIQVLHPAVILVYRRYVYFCYELPNSISNNNALISYIFT